MPDILSVLPCLCDDTRRFQKNADDAQGRLDLHRKLWLDAKPLGAMAIELLDASLRILTIPAHVPLTDRAVRTWNGIRPSDDADHEISWREPRSFRRFKDLADRFVADDEMVSSGRRRSVTTGHDLDISPTDVDAESLREQSTIFKGRFGHAADCARVRQAGNDGKGAHDETESDVFRAQRGTANRADSTCGPAAAMPARQSAKMSARRARMNAAKPNHCREAFTSRIVANLWLPPSVRKAS